MDDRGAKVAVLDAGASNAFNVMTALARVGLSPYAARSAGDLDRADAVVFPGVANFGTICGSIDALRVRGALLRRLGAGTPYLGICAGFQALFEGSEEAPDACGLGIIAGSVKRLRSPKVPHIGWARCDLVRDTQLLESGWAYFAHSYAPPSDVRGVIACARYGEPFAAAYSADGITGVQFHPEKSSAYGAAFLKQWAESWDAV